MLPTPQARRAALLAALVAAGGACFRGTLPPRELYRLRPPAGAASPAAADGSRTFSAAALEGGSPVLAVPLVVDAYATPGVYAEPQIVYRVGETRYGTYPTREWALPLGAMLAALTAEALRAEPATGGRVQEGAGPGAARGLVWRGSVREFEEVDRGALVFAAVRLEAQLVRAADDSVLWQGATRIERPVTPPRAIAAVVDSLSALSAAAVAGMVREAAPALRAAAAAQAGAQAAAGRARPGEARAPR